MLQQRHASLGALFEDKPELGERIATFWEEACCFTELDILTGLADAFACQDLGEYLDRIGKAAASPAPELRLSSELEEDRVVFLERLDVLRRSPKRRKEYLALLADLWEPVDQEWHSVGLESIALAAERYRSQLESGTRWPDIIPTACEQTQHVMPGLVQERATQGTVLMAPCYFFGTSMFLDLPDLVVVGLPSLRGDEESRARTEAIARRLKTLADPTRLAIVDYLSKGPRAVGEIARTFDLAQPTVSAHVKLLREAGIIHATRNGSRLEHSVDAGSIEGLFDQLRTVLT
jgi:ArsR family transcriptional regulator